MSLKLGFEEAISNVIKYAYPKNSVGKVFIRAYREDEHFFVEIKDNGVPFNPLAMRAEKKSADLEEVKEGGLGIFFMRNIFDEIEYNYKSEGEMFFNHLKLVMKLSKERDKVL